MTTEDLDAKFNALSAALLKPDRQRRIRDMVFACEKMGVREMMQGLAA
jgi:hypothetical protein